MYVDSGWVRLLLLLLLLLINVIYVGYVIRGILFRVTRLFASSPHIFKVINAKLGQLYSRIRHKSHPKLGLMLMFKNYIRRLTAH